MYREQMSERFQVKGDQKDTRTRGIHCAELDPEPGKNIYKEHYWAS